MPWSELQTLILRTAYSPSTFKKAGDGQIHRNNDGFVSCDLLVLDIDNGGAPSGGPGLAEAPEVFGEYSAIIAPTKNHNKEKWAKAGAHPACDRYRVLIPLERGLTTAEEFRAVRTAAFQRWSFIDDIRDEARYYDPSISLYRVTEGKKFKYFDTLAQAKVYYLRSQYQGKVHEESKLERTAGEAGMLFGEVVKVWEQVWLPNKNVSTQIRYRSYLQHFRIFWNVPVEKIGPGDIDRWIAEMKKPAYLVKGHTTRCDYKHEFSVLRGILNFYASRYNRNYRLPFLKDHKSMLKVREKMKISKDLTVDEFQKFMDALKEVCAEYDCEVVYYLAFMQYATCCRVQEAAALHYEDFDFGRNRIIINKKIQWPRAKGLHTVLVDGSKANGGKVTPMGELAGKVFKEWAIKSGVRSGLLFRSDGEILSYRQIEYRYTQALHRAGLPFRATHLLRHASLTEFYDHSKDLLLTAKMAGQRDIRSTMKYTKVRDEKVIQVQKEMDEKLSKLKI